MKQFYAGLFVLLFSFTELIAQAPIITYSGYYSLYPADTAIGPISLSNTGGAVQARMVNTFAGAGVSGNINGFRTAARFADPSGIAVDASGNVYVADQTNHLVRKITPGGAVSTLAGSGVAGSANGTGTGASFKWPTGIAVDASGNVYVGEEGNYLIRKITPAGVVTTLAGSGVSGSTDATGTSASFAGPSGLVVDASGNVYVADSWNNKIRKITPGGVVTTYAGTGATGAADGAAASATFNNPVGIAIDASGNLYIGDNFGNKIRKISSLGVVSTLAGSGAGGSLDGTGAGATFSSPKGLTVDAAGNVYVCDQANHRIRKITPAGVVTTYGGISAGSADGVNTSATFNYPIAIAIDAAENLYIADRSNHKIRKYAKYGISPALPAGLVFDENTGGITGTPTGSVASTKYVTSAYNASGTDTASITFSVSGQLNGIYTIDSFGSGSRNFVNFTAAVNRLISNGVSGPVVFNVAARTYIESISIPAITGASATNTITFEGTNKTNRIISYPTDAVTKCVWRFNACNYVTVRNITIRSTTTTESWTATFFDGSNNKLNNCTIEITGSGATSTNFPIMGVVITGSTSSFNYSTLANNHRIDSCVINAGYYNIYSLLLGSTNNLFITNNTLNNGYIYGIQDNGGHVAKIINNTINLRASNIYNTGMYLASLSFNGSNVSEVSYNKINNPGQRGIVIYNCYNSSTNYGLFYNNIVYEGRANGFVGIEFQSSAYWNMYQNTVINNFNSTGGTNLCLYGNYSSFINVRNNIFAVTRSSALSAYPVSAFPSTAFSAMDNNIYYNASGPRLLTIGTNDYDGTNFAGAFPLGGGISSFNTNPLFVSNTDAHILTGCNNGANLGVTPDMDGNARGTTPDIGADEKISVINNDLGVVSINTPNFPLSTGVKTVNVTLKNYGDNTITSATLNYSINGAAPVTYSWTGSIAPCATASVSFPTTCTIASGTTNLKVYSSAPNGSSDPVNVNDTAQWTLCPAMSGTYTIGGGGNYATITAAINDLACAGVSGNVVFNIASGTYSGTYTIPQINGASATKTITFQPASGLNTSVILSASPSSASGLFFINGTDYLRLNKLTFNNTNSGSFPTILIGNEAHYNIISNCIINMTGSAAMGIEHVHSTDNFNEFSNNVINNGNFAINYYSFNNIKCRGVRILNNKCNNQYSAGIYFAYSDSSIVHGNYVNSNSNNVNYYGIKYDANPNGGVLTNNKVVVTNSAGGYGIITYNFNYQALAGNRGLIANNMVSISGTGNTRGLSLEANTNITDVYHNTVLMTNTNTAATALFLNSSGSTSNLRNNIFQNNGTGLAIDSYSGFTYDNNNLFTRGATFGRHSGISYANFTNYKAAAGQNVSSVSKEVSFYSTTDLHTNTGCINNLGANVQTVVPLDIDSAARSTTPDLGADEFSVFARDIQVKYVTSPNVTVVNPVTSYTVGATVFNNGTTAVTSLTLSYRVNGGTAVSQTYTSGAGLPVGGLLPCDTVALTFSTTTLFTGSGNNELKVYPSSINSLSDQNAINDTAIRFYCAPFTGTFTINKNSPASATNFTSINSAYNTLFSCGISGPVTLRIVQGSGPYTEQLSFVGNIPGSSAINKVRLSGNTTREVITFTPNISTDQHVIRLNGTKNLIFDSLTILNNGSTFGVGVLLMNQADSNIVRNCNIIIPVGTSFYQNSACIALSVNNNLPNGFANNGNANKFENNYLSGGYYGVIALGTNNANFNLRNEFTGNKIVGQTYWGLMFQYQDFLKVNRNTIDSFLPNNTASAGIFCYYVERFEMNANRINRVGTQAMNMQFLNYQNGTGTDRSQMINNMIGGIFYGTNPFAIYFVNYARNIDFWHNTVHVPNIGNGYTIFMQYTSNGTLSGIDMRNNTFSSTNNSAVCNYLYYYNSGLTPPTPFSAFANNNFYYTNTTSPGILIGQNAFVGTSWILPSINGLNTSTCKYVNPMFLNEQTDLHSIGNSLNDVGVNIPAVTTDIDGETRPISPSTTVDIGADEYNVPLYNIGATAIISPVAVFTGPQNVVAQLFNYGAATITSATVKYKLGLNGAVKTTSWTGSMAPNASATVTFSGASQITPTIATDTIIVWTELPNGNTDAYNANDTFYNTPTCLPISGTVTVNAGLPASSTNFTSFGSLARVLNYCGITGPVTVNVASGTYNEQFELKQIPGSSAVNSVTIQSASGVASSVVLQFNNATATTNNYVMYMNGTDYLTLRNLTLSSTNTLFGSTNILQANNSGFNTFSNVIFNGPSSAVYGNNFALVYANNSSFNLPGIGDDNNTFDGCTFNNGAYGIFYYGSYGSNYSRNTTVKNCSFYNQNNVAINFNFHFSINILNNLISSNTTNTSFQGIYFYGGGVVIPGTSRIVKNKIDLPNGGYGMQFYYFIGSDYLTANNTISVGSGNSTAYGIYLYYCNSKFYHNTINIKSGNTSNQAAYIYSASYAPLTCDFKYNIVANTGNGTSAGQCIYSFGNNTSYTLIDSNVYYQGTGATNFGSNNSGNWATFAAWKTSMGASYDGASIIANPSFVSPTDLHVSAIGNLRPTPVHPLVTDDMDNATRCGITDAGADHHPSGLDAGISNIVYPANGIANVGLKDIKVALTNFGLTTLTSANVSYNISGTVQTKSWTGSLASCATDTVVFTGAQQYNFTTSYTMKSYTDNPNGLTDPNTTNDTFTKNGCIGMGGLYTIDPLGSGPNNFTTIGAAVTALQGCGINTPVVFQLAATTFNEQVNIPSTIVGVNSTNTITFLGTNRTNTIITFATTAANPHVVRFNNCRYVTFNRLTIRSTGTNDGWVAHFLNGTNNSIVNCNIEFTGTAAISSANNLVGVVVNNSTNFLSTQSLTANNHVIDSCTINAGYYGVYDYNGNGSNVFTCKNSNLINAYFYAFFATGAHALKVINNTVTLRATNPNCYGISINSCATTAPNFHQVNYNKITNSSYFGIHLSYADNSATARGQLYNNTINGFRTEGGMGIYMVYSNYWNLYHNTINYDRVATGTGSNSCINMYYGSNNIIRNNILSVSRTPAATGAVTNLVLTSSTAVSALDNNIYYSVNNGKLIDNVGVSLYGNSAIAAYPLGGGINSLISNPSFVSSTDVHITNPCNNGANLGITDDIDGNVRGTTPDIGSDEMATIPNNEIGVISINSPNFPLATGSQSINVTIKNYGTSTLTSANISYTVNNGPAQTYAWTGSLNTCDTVSVTLPTPYNFGSGSSNLKVFTSLPNGSADANNGNDTAQWTLCPSLSGTYTIGPNGGGNYATINAAVSDLICAGISGPVVFNIRPGVYNETIIIPQIQGTGPTKTITFQPLNGVNTSVLITANPSGNGILFLNGTDYIKISKLSFAHQFSSGAPVILLGNEANNNTISGCNINMISTNGTGIDHTHSTDNNLTIENCNFYNGRQGIYFYSFNTLKCRNIRILNNNFYNQYFSAVYFAYSDSSVVRGNYVTTNTTAYFEGIKYDANPNGGEFTNNKIVITAASSGYGLMTYNFNYNAVVGNRGVIANNMVSLGGTGSLRAFALEANTYNTDVYHNTVHVYNTNSTTKAFYFAGSSSGSNVRNNIFQNIGPGYAIETNNTGTLDYNDLYTRGTNIGLHNGVNYTTFANYKAAAGQNVNSVNKQVFFVSNTDLHTTNPTTANLGTNLSSVVSYDIDSIARTTTPDLGADEYANFNNDAAMMNIITPTTAAVYGTNYTVNFTVRNNGLSPINTLVVNYDNGGTINTQTYTSGVELPVGGLLSNDTISLSFTTQLTVGMSKLLKVYTGNVNGVADQQNSNDTLTRGLCVAYNGTYTINKNIAFSTTNFTSVAQAVNALYECGIAGNVTLRIVSGTGPYNEQVYFNGLIPGSGPTRTVRLTGNTTREQVTFAPAIPNQQYVFRLAGVKYVTLDSLTITNTGTNFGVGVQLKANADSNTIKNSTINISSAASLNQNSAGIVMADSLVPYNVGMFAQNTKIDNNTINGGMYGVLCSGNYGSFVKRNEVTNNRLYGQTGVAIEMYLQDSVKINGNIIDSMSTVYNTSTGIEMNESEHFEVMKNKINRVGQYGIVLGGTGLNFWTERSQIINNMIGGIFYHPAPIGMQFNNILRNVDCWFNTIHIENIGNGSAFDMNYASNDQFKGFDMRNNTFSGSANTDKIVRISYPNTGLTPQNPFTVFGNNNIYGDTTSKYVQIGQDSFATNAWIGASINGLNTSTCLNLNPQFVNAATNLHINQSNLNNKGVNIALVSTDIDGETRPMAPSFIVDIGADEFTPLLYDLSAFAVISPVTPVNPGAQDVVIQIKNIGTPIITSANVRYKVGRNGTVKSTTYSGSLAQNATANVTFTGANQYNFTGGRDTIFAWTDGPNGFTDVNLINDTISSVVCTKLSGTYTIGGTSPNFNTLSEAAAVLNCAGVSGPVIFNVRTGVYNDSVAINNIVGSSTINTVTFQSEAGNKDSVTVQNNTVGTYVLKITNADNLTIRNMTFKTTVTNNSPLQILASGDSCVNITVYGNKFSGVYAAADTTKTGIRVRGDVPNLIIRKNEFTRLSYGIYATGRSVALSYTRNLLIDSNSFYTETGNDVANPIYVSLFKTPIVKCNTVEKSSCCGDNVFNFSNIGNGGEIAYNKIISSASFNSGILVIGANLNGETNHVLIYNNFISQSAGTQNMVLNSARYVKVFNNSLNYFGATCNFNCRVSISTNVRIVNNIFKTPAGYISLYLDHTNLANARAQIVECDNNNYYQGTGAASELIVRAYLSNYTLATLKGAIITSPKNDSNSLNINPNFTSNADLHIATSNALAGAGKTLAEFTDDVDGTPRATPYSIGADDVRGIRITSGDYVTSSGCINLSGSNWIDVSDSTGRLVFSINPEGNNLGATCWGIRINTGSMRKDSIYNSADGLKYLSYLMDRNLYINPTIQPAPGTMVSIKFYVKLSEWQRMSDTATALGFALDINKMKIHRLHQSGATTALSPITMPGVSDSSHFLASTGLGVYGADRFMQFRTNHFSQFNPVFIPNVNPFLLPVTWLSFDAKAAGEDALISWTTASEKNSDYFEVERSTDGVHFEPIHKTKAAGFSNNVTSYGFEDKYAAAVNSLLYYRIKQVDVDGSFDYTKIKAVNFDVATNITVDQIYPNPFGSDVTVSYQLKTKTAINMVVFDTKGQTVYNTTFVGKSGQHEQLIDLSLLESGAYFIKVNAEGSSYQFKMIKN